MRTLFAWEKEGKFYLSFFNKNKLHVNGKIPASEFSSKQELLDQVRSMRDGQNRSPDVEWMDG